MRRPTMTFLALTAVLASSLGACGSASTPTASGASSSAASATASAAASADTSSATTDAAATPSVDATTPSGTPNASGTATPTSAAAGTIPLTRDVPKVTTAGAHDLPYLAFRFDGGWTQTVRDTNGTDQWKQPSTSCQVTAINDASTGAGSDAAATDRLLADLTGSVRKEVPTARLSDVPSVVLPRTGAPAVEFDAQRLDYTGTADGKRWTSYFLGRAFVADGVVLAVNVSCPTATADARPNLYREIVANGHIASAVNG